ncbi:hypothetical protein Val02_82730 [Virgisporangium aliadipatigenens]|uniref:Uncharacterized protein n=1 Tax=Virgisporangium aliadipatigenens TaxID=741659 RepID=A0A8J4DWS3_9ACTN|nr:hypothetical protein Val02_82730 [Virgisporangium aliadipatigenens]
MPANSPVAASICAYGNRRPCARPAGAVVMCEAAASTVPGAANAPPTGLCHRKTSADCVAVPVAARYPGVCAVMAGYRSYTAIGEWVAELPDGGVSSTRRGSAARGGTSMSTLPVVL